MTMTMFSFNNVTARVGSFSLNIEDCRLEKGGIYAVVGPNGCGKTTFLDLAGLLHRPSSGELMFGDGTVDFDNSPALVGRRRRIGYLMQDPYLFNTSVRNNVEYGLKLRDMPSVEVRKKTADMLERLMLAHLADKRAHELSGGEAQRVALARTLVLDTEVLLLDEPTANMDHESIGLIEKMVLELNSEKGTTIVFSTHLREQAYRMSKNTISIINGRIHDIAYENVFSGRLVLEKGGVRSVSVTDTVGVKVADGEPGTVSIAIDPQDIILSTGELESSALNRCEGRISKIEEMNGSLRVFVDVGVELCTVVTRRSFDDMGLNIGKSVWATFKANAVKVIEEGQ